MEIYGNNSLNYDNLKNKQYNIRNLIKYKISFNNINYILIGVINMPYYNYYNCCIINSLYENIYIEKNKNIFNDGQLEFSKSISEKFNLNNLNNYLNNFIVASAIYASE